MALEPDARLIVNREVDVRKLPITPADFFVFSRVEAASSGTTVGEVIATSGQPVATAEQSIRKLLELEVLTLGPSEPADPPNPPRSKPAREPSSETQLRQRARDRKRDLLAAQLRVTQAAELEHVTIGEAARAGPESTDQDTLPTPRDDQKPAVAEHRSILETITPVAATDRRLDPALAVPVEIQRRMLALRDQLRQTGHFEILGLEPVDDARVIRRAYHVVSRDFHPDTYFGKDLGSLRPVLDDLFRRARASYEFLLDGSRRKTLVEVHETQLREEHERQMAGELELRKAAHAAEEAERRRLEAEIQARHEKAQVQRFDRDLARQQRLHEQAAAERRRQASAHAEQAVREREIGRHGTAATLFRLAHEHDSEHPDYEREWRESLLTARRDRAKAQHQAAKIAQAAGRPGDAARRFLEAAEADPSLRNLTDATAAMAEVDPGQARSLAMTTLETLNQAQSQDAKVEERVAAQAHLACAKAFLAAGQLATAREQAERATVLGAGKQARALLNSVKLP